MGQYWPLFLIFIFSIQSTVNVQYNFLPITRFEPRTSVVWSYCSTNCPKYSGMFGVGFTPAQEDTNFVREVSLRGWLTVLLSCFAYVELTANLLACSNQNHSNRRSDVQWIFPLWSRWVFSYWHLQGIFVQGKKRMIIGALKIGP